MKAIKTTSLLVSVCTAVLLAIGCDDSVPGSHEGEKPVVVTPEPIAPTPQELIAGTWQLLGFVNAETGAITEPERNDNPDSYSLILYAQGYGTATSLENKFEVNLSENNEDLSWKRLSNQFDGVQDSYVSLFYDAVRTIESYSFEEDELKFFYNSQGDYLLYKRVGPPPFFNTLPLIGTHWKLVGFVDAATEVLKEAEPKDERYYTLTFDANNELTIISSADRYWFGYRLVDNNTMQFSMFVGSGEHRHEVNEDGKLYRDVFYSNELISFVVSENSLKLYYNRKKNYLLFEKRDELAPLQTLFPLDWEGYNDMLLIYRNIGVIKSEHIGKSIGVYGWILRPEHSGLELDPSYFYLTNSTFQWGDPLCLPIKAETPEVAEQLRIKFENCDWTKKCYIKGLLNLDDYNKKDCCMHALSCKIVIANADDIYFE